MTMPDTNAAPITAETRFSRAWAMPNHATFSIPPIAALLGRWLAGCASIIDPFSRGSSWGTVTNDLDPTTAAMYHMEAGEFCDYLLAHSVTATAVLFDPPYSPRQISEMYRGIGRKVGIEETQNGRLYKRVRDGLDRLLVPGGIAVSCGWNTNGFGLSRGYRMEEVLLVAHGGAHNDTLVTVERKIGNATCGVLPLEADAPAKETR
jgi:hypothetical protein